ncbi:TIR domain-containing protein [Parerythrobacter jejuensis]|uniref:TIR domain-containing protein n=1 Tax=Parerythrobacter jejuensis TaxID=795812 RepID=A0A845AMD4_9SPHN|nr:TIR domain-containing protein [Parerythrobacter jejuensis]MXP31420.1 TIR domain-containing protein [Parerythrobacter jejuensis]
MSDADANRPMAFVSYSRGDQDAARAIIDRLEAAGITVWWDGLLDGGARYGDVTEQNLESARAVVVLWSATSVKSHWVHDEATRGRDRGCLVPVSIDGTEPPLGFRQFQCITVADQAGPFNEDAIARLIDSVRNMVAGGDGQDQTRPAAPSTTLPPTASTGSFAINRRWAIGGGAALLAGAGGLAAWQGGLIGGARSNSIAVLPFETIGSGKDQAYFADGLAAEIRSRLARNPLLKVAAKASSSSFRDSGVSATDIADKLKVAFLLNGDVRRDGDQLRVTASLTDGNTGFTARQLSYDRAVDGIFEIQGAIASAVIGELTAEIEGRNTGEQVGGTESVAAYEIYLQARELYDAGIDESSDRRSVTMFDNAIAIDPDYAAAHASKSRALALIGNLYAAPDQRDTVFGAAEKAALEAVRIAPEYADGHSVLGYVRSTGKLDIKGAQEPYQRSYELGAGDADILSRYAIFQSRLDNAAAATEAIERAVSLDPLNARVFKFKGDIAYGSGEPEKAIEHFAEAKAIRDGLSSYHYGVGLAQLELGQDEAARDSFAEDPFFVWQKTGGAIAEHRLGNREAAQAHLDALKAEYGDKSNYQYLQIYAQWGEQEAALAAMADAVRLRDSGLVQLYLDPLLEPVRSTGPYRELVARLGFV